jgi:N-acetylmuramoyl-L-alanine amidase
MKKLLLRYRKYSTGFMLLALVVLVYCLFGISDKAHAAIESPDMLKDIYNQVTATSTRKVRILLVPGHDNEYWGTQFRNVKEADLNLLFEGKLYAYLKNDPQFEIFTVRSSTATDPNSYTETFAQYFAQNATAINDFTRTSSQTYSTQVSTGQIQKVEGVAHNKANPDAAFRLYGTNKWINDNNIDYALHIHFNDAPGRPADNPGPYRGFAIYVPERQYDNAYLSSNIAHSIYDQLSLYYSQSILPKEDTGIVEDQGLIAIGPGNSLKAASTLIEYGYIYEPQYLDPVIREKVISDLAFQTYLGIHRFFGDAGKYVGEYGTPLLPYTWTKSASYGDLYNPDVLALQAALRNIELYPAPGKESLDCRMTGNFTPCVRAGLAAFQKKYKITGGDGTIIGPKTRKKLNALFSN